MTSERREEVAELLGNILRRVADRFRPRGSPMHAPSKMCLVSVKSSVMTLWRTAWIPQSYADELLSELRVHLVLSGISDDEAYVEVRDEVAAGRRLRGIDMRIIDDK